MVFIIHYRSNKSHLFYTIDPGTQDLSISTLNLREIKLPSRREISDLDPKGSRQRSNSPLSLISFLQERISNTHNKAKLCYALGLDLLIRDAKASLSKDQASLFKADRCNRKIIRSKVKSLGPHIFLIAAQNLPRPVGLA